MSKMLTKVKDTTRNVTFGSLKFAGAVGLGVVGSAMALGVKANHHADSMVNGIADALSVYIINDLAVTRLEEQINFGMQRHQQQGRDGVNWAMMSASMDDSYQYGR